MLYGTTAPVVEWDRDLTIKPLADDRPTVYVATIQGLRASGALSKPLDGVACVVIDEAHHGAADSYLSLTLRGPQVQCVGEGAGPHGDALPAGARCGLGLCLLVGGARPGRTVHAIDLRRFPTGRHKSASAPKLIASTARDRVEARGRDEDATEANLAKLLWLRARQAGAKTAVAFCRDIRRSRLLVDVLRGAGVRASTSTGARLRRIENVHWPSSRRASSRSWRTRHY